MSKIPEIQQRLERITKLGKQMQNQVTRLNKPEGDALKQKTKEQGTRLGIGVGVSCLGLMLAALVAIYLPVVIILAVNVALDRLWLSSLIVVGGFIIIGVGIIAIGGGIAAKSAKELSKIRQDTTRQIKQTSNELKTEVAGLQEAAKLEAVDLKAQLAGPAKLLAPTSAAAFMGYRVLAKVLSRRREKRMMAKVVRMVDEAREKEKK